MAALRLCLLLCFVIQALAGEEPILFLTWRVDPCTTMDVRWLRPSIPPCDSHVRYRALGEDSWREAQGENYRLPGSDYRVSNVHLTGLFPDTLYEFQIVGTRDKHTFRTLPATLSRPLRVAVGGDVYDHGLNRVEAMNRKAAALDPDFVLWGGDIAYSGPLFRLFPENVRNWITLMDLWSRTMITAEGRCIPLLASIGNHDVSGRYHGGPEHAQAFYSLLLHPHKKAHRTLDIGDHTTLIFLDTGHTASIAGPQTEWLEEALKGAKGRKHLLALYHVPAYPARRKLERGRSPQVRAHWVPLFERYGLHVAFEHHDHSYKRTYPLIQGEHDPDGVLYLGDGGWGVTPRTPASADSRSYLAHTAAKQHLILVELAQRQRSFLAIDAEGQIFDCFSQPLTRNAL